MIGNAHIDPVWLWPWSEGISVVYSTYRSALDRKNATPPASVQQSLAKSQYKDWTVEGDKELIKYYNTQKDIEEHYRITVEKNNLKKTISFNYTESAPK